MPTGRRDERWRGCGDATMAMRALLRRMRRRRFNPGSAASMAFLNTTRPRTIRLARRLMIDWGYRTQRLGHRALHALGEAQVRRPPATTGGRPPVKEQVVHFVNKKLPAGLPSRAARALLDVEDRRYVPILRDPRRTPADAEAVFYFPGCGSEKAHGKRAVGFCLRA